MILAAGSSVRLGFPKAFARFGRKTALQIAVENCAGLERPVVVVASRSAEVRSSIPKAVRLVVNRRPGQLSSLLAGLKHVPTSAHFMLYPVDYPLLDRGVIRKLVAGFHSRTSGQEIAMPGFRKRAGHPVIFSAGLRRELQRAETAREVVYRDPERVRVVQVGTAAIWKDIDTPGAYRRRVLELQRRDRNRSRLK